MKGEVLKGDALAGEAWSFGGDDCQFRASELRQAAPQYSFVEDGTRCVDELAGEMIGGVRIDVAASYIRHPHGPTKKRAPPYNDQDSVEIVDEMRKDVENGRMFAKP